MRYKIIAGGIIAAFLAIIIAAVVLLTVHNQKINRFDHHCRAIGGTAMHARDLSLCVRNGLIVDHI